GPDVIRVGCPAIGDDGDRTMFGQLERQTQPCHSAADDNKINLIHSDDPFTPLASVPIRLKIPRKGIATHFGRLLSSYRSSYKAFRIKKLRSKSRRSSGSFGIKEAFPAFAR